MKKLIVGILSLTMFAENDTNRTTDEGMSPEMIKFYNKNLIKEFKPQLVHSQFAQKRPLPKHGGKTVDFRKFESLPPIKTPLEEGVTPKGQKIKVTNKTATIEQYGAFAEYSDIISTTTVDNTILEMQELLATQGGQTMDIVDRDIMHSTTNVLYAPKSDGTEVTSKEELDDTCKVTVDLIKRGVNILTRMNAKPIDKYFVCIIHPDISYDIMSDKEWIEASLYAGSQQIFEGEIGKIGRVRFVESTMAKIFDSGVYGTLLLGANAYGTIDLEGMGLQTIIKALGSGGTADPLNQRGTIGWKGAKTGIVLSPEYILDIYSKSTNSSIAKAN